jgi:hypothetical protein
MPVDGMKMRAMSCMKVVLPNAAGPETATSWPASTSTEMAGIELGRASSYLNVTPSMKMLFYDDRGRFDRSSGDEGKAGRMGGWGGGGGGGVVRVARARQARARRPSAEAVRVRSPSDGEGAARACEKGGASSRAAATRSARAFPAHAPATPTRARAPNTFGFTSSGISPCFSTNSLTRPARRMAA